jgi:hypothetical protein
MLFVSDKSIIVYRSQGEAMRDQWLYEDGGFIYILVSMAIMIFAVFVWSKVEPILRQLYYKIKRFK